MKCEQDGKANIKSISTNTFQQKTVPTVSQRKDYVKEMEHPRTKREILDHLFMYHNIGGIEPISKRTTQGLHCDNAYNPVAVWEVRETSQAKIATRIIAHLVGNDTTHAVHRIK